MRNKEVECPKGKWLDVIYSPLDDKPEYRQPILCRAKDIGKIVYGMWIIGDKQYGKFQDDSRSDDEEKFYTAYKLVKGAGIVCNFAMDETLLPFITKIAYPTDASRADASWDYAINSHIDSFRPRYEPNYAERNGVPYIVMPSGMDAKQTDDAAEEKFADRPQILKGDIVRVEFGSAAKWSCHIVSVADDRFLETDLGENLVDVEDVIAIYRFCGKGFDCIWQDEEAMERYAKEAEGEKHDPKKEN